MEDSMNYLFKRGEGVNRRKVHYSLFDPRTGKPSMRPLCDVNLDFNTTCNFPMGLKLCKKCKKEATR